MNNDDPDKPAALFDNTLRSLLDRRSSKERNGARRSRSCNGILLFVHVYPGWVTKLNDRGGKLKGREMENV